MAPSFLPVLQGECQVQRQAAIKSNGDDLVFHTPTGGDFLFSSSDPNKTHPN